MACAFHCVIAWNKKNRISTQSRNEPQSRKAQPHIVFFMASLRALFFASLRGIKRTAFSTQCRKGKPQRPSACVFFTSSLKSASSESDLINQSKNNMLYHKHQTMRLLFCIGLFVVLHTSIGAQTTMQAPMETHDSTKQTMTIDIWSDIACPFCYIGKRHLEAALANTGLTDSVQVVWHSYQLDPSVKTAGGENYLAHLSAKKGWSMAQTESIVANVTAMAEAAGLHYRFDKMIVANTFLAHRFIHLAKQYNLQDEAKEALLQAHFVDGIDVGNEAALTKIGQQIGIPTEALAPFFASTDYTKEVEADIAQAAQMRISGVPFFVFNGKYTVSGAQPVAVFESALQQSMAESQKP